MPPTPDRRRRTLLGALAVAPLSLPAVATWARVPVTGDICRLAPETTAGPFYFDPGLVRPDIAEGLPGVPLKIVLQVVDERCRPIDGARVDVWHCDAGGNYSGYARQGSDRIRDTRGQSFLRGTQFADLSGVVRFGSIWPGWYSGRTPHVHYRVFLDATTVLTSQLFFPDGASETVFRAAPYRGRTAAQETTNANDGIARRAGPAAYARVSRVETGWRAELAVGVDPEA